MANWLARNKNGKLFLFFYRKPLRRNDFGCFENTSGLHASKLVKEWFPEVTWENSPVKSACVTPPQETLTGKELRFAAQHGLKVLYVEELNNETGTHQERWTGVMRPTKTKSEYYIGSSDINVSRRMFADNDKVVGETDSGMFAVYSVSGVRYAR